MPNHELLQIRVLGIVERFIKFTKFFVKTRFFARFNRFILNGIKKFLSNTPPKHRFRGFIMEGIFRKF